MKDQLIARRGASSFPVSIFIAGDPAAAEGACRAYCFEHGLCVTVTQTSYVFTGGAEAGVIVGLINYPRFPKQDHELQEQAEHLARYLMDRLFQGSCTIEDPYNTTWLSRRGD